MDIKKKPFYSLILSAILLLQVVAITTVFSPQIADAGNFVLETGPESRGKFVAYTDNVEVRGTVVGTEPGAIYLIPDSDYRNLLLPGNEIAPREEPTNRNDKDAYRGYLWYRDTIAVNLPALGYSADQKVPILKLEPGGYCERNGSAECYPPNEDSAILRYENGTDVRTRIIDGQTHGVEVQPGDRVKITGVYAIDYAHSWWSHLCEEISTRMERGLKICFAHAEFHPYWSSFEKRIVLLEPLTPGKPNVESHIVVAPVYTEFYSATWPPNWVRGVSCGANAVKIGHCKGFVSTVHSSLKADITSEFFIEAPPQTAECIADASCQMTLQESNITKIGDANVVEKVKQDNGWLIKVRARSGESPWTPSIYQSTWSVSWSVGPDNSDPDTSIIRAQDSSGRIISNGSSTQSTSIRFTYTGTDNVRVVGYNCSLDGSAPSPCPDGTKDYSELSLGNHVFQVAARDEAGNVDKTPATYTWTVREGADIPRICIVRPWLPQCDPNQQSLTTQETSPPATTNTTEDELVQESTDMTSSPEAQAVTEPLTVQIIPNATQGIVPATFQFDANIAGGTEPYTITWNIGEDRTESDEERVLHTFDEAGTYDVTLTATDSDGETLSDSMEVQVLEPEEEEPLEEGDEEGITNGEADEGAEENTET